MEKNNAKVQEVKDNAKKAGLMGFMIGAAAGLREATSELFTADTHADSSDGGDDSDDSNDDSDD